MTKIFIAGHNGMVGAAIRRNLGFQNSDLVVATREELDLIDQSQVRTFFKKHSFDQVYLAAAKVGGINANNLYPAEFIYQNLMIQNNVIHESFLSGVKKLLFLGSSCIYPKLAKQPISEKQLLKGELEPTNEPYALAKIAGIKMCESYNRQYLTDYRSLMPTNLYGPGDNYHLENSHVIPGMLRRCHEAKVNGLKHFTVWGSGGVMREFLHVDDLAEAATFVMNLDKSTYEANTSPTLSHLNVGSGIEISIKELAELVAEIVGFKGTIIWDKSMPDGTPRKLMDSSTVSRLGWSARYTLADGIRNAYSCFLESSVQ